MTTQQRRLSNPGPKAGLDGIISVVMEAPRLTRLAWTYSWWSSSNIYFDTFKTIHFLHQKIKYLYAYSIAETFVKRRKRKRERERQLLQYIPYIYIHIYYNILR